MTSRRKTAMTVWLAAICVYIVAIAGRTSFGVAGLEAAHRFGIGAGSLSLFTVVQLAVYAACQIPVGILLDRFGTRIILAVGAIIMAAGQICLGIVGSFELALFARVLIGMGDATAFTAVLRLIPAWFSPRRAPLFTQLTGQFGLVGQFISSVPFAFVLKHWGWTPAFVILGVAGIVIGSLSVFVVRDNRGQGALISFRKAEERLSAQLHTTVIDAEDRPQMRVALMNPGAWLGFWTHFTCGFSAFVFTLLWGVPYLRIVAGYSEKVAAASLILYTVFSLFLGPLIGEMVARHPLRRTWLVHGAGISLVVMWTWVIVTNRINGVSLFLLFFALALSSAMSSVGFDFARTTVHPDRLGIANGLINMGGFVAALIASGLIGLTIDIIGEGMTPHAMRCAFATQLGIWILGTLMIEIYKRKTRKKMAEEGIIVPPIREVIARYQAIFEQRRREAKEAAAAKDADTAN